MQFVRKIKRIEADPDECKAVLIQSNPINVVFNEALRYRKRKKYDLVILVTSISSQFNANTLESFLNIAKNIVIVHDCLRTVQDTPNGRKTKTLDFYRYNGGCKRLTIIEKKWNGDYKLEKEYIAHDIEDEKRFYSHLLLRYKNGSGILILGDKQGRFIEAALSLNINCTVVENEPHVFNRLKRMAESVQTHIYRYTGNKTIGG